MSLKKNEIKSNIILLAEDDDDHYFLMQNAFKTAKSFERLYRVVDGAEVMNYLLHENQYQNKEEYPLPLKVILDLNLPKKDGREVLREMKANPQLKDIPVIILTTSINEEDESNSYRLGAQHFFKKPVFYKEYMEIIKKIST